MIKPNDLSVVSLVESLYIFRCGKDYQVVRDLKS